jgi:ABC-type hemin transport system substrate-binding protein
LRPALPGWLALAFLLLLVDCRPSPPSPAPGLRLVSTVPSLTEQVFAAGAGGLLVGRSVHCDWPADALALPSTGSGLEPDLERLLSLGATHVLITPMQARLGWVAGVRAHGVEVVELPDESLDDVVRSFEGLAALLAQAGDASATGARAQADAFRQALASWRSEPPPPDPPPTLVVVGRDPLFVAAGDTRLGALVGLSGGRAVPPSGGWVQLDDEALLGLGPAVIVDLTGEVDGGAFWDRRVPWTGSPPRVCVVPADPLARPGPRMIEGQRLMAGCLGSGD